MIAILKNKILWLSIIFIAIAFVAYTYFFEPGNTTPLVVTVGSTEDIEQGRVITQLLGSLDTIRLDDTIFSSPEFQSLQDFSVPVDPEQQGRINPFAPIGSEFATPEPEAQESAQPSAVPGL